MMIMNWKNIKNPKKLRVGLRHLVGWDEGERRKNWS